MQHAFFTEMFRASLRGEGSINGVQTHSLDGKGNIDRIVPPGHTQLVQIKIANGLHAVVIKAAESKTANTIFSLYLPPELNPLYIFMQTATATSNRRPLINLPTQEIQKYFNAYLRTLDQQQQNPGVISKDNLISFLEKSDLSHFINTPRAGRKLHNAAEILIQAYEERMVNPDFPYSSKSGSMPSDAVFTCAIKFIEMSIAHGLNPILLDNISGMRCDRQFVKAAMYYAAFMGYDKSHHFQQRLFSDIIPPRQDNHGFLHLKNRLKELRNDLFKNNSDLTAIANQKILPETLTPSSLDIASPTASPSRSRSNSS